MADENMRVSQMERVVATGIEINTIIFCGLRYEDMYVVSFASLVNDGDAAALIERTRRERVKALFSTTWDKLRG